MICTFDAFKRLKSGLVFTLTDEQLCTLQKILLTILDDIDCVCGKYGISYSLGGGSCLGAVRHQGFIPWDDDLDINMARSEYEKFIPAFRREFGRKYWVHTPEDTPGYELLFARVRLKGTVLRTRDDFFTDECGIPVDIFIVENTFDNWAMRMLHGIGCMAFGYLLSCRKFRRARKQLTALSGGSRSLSLSFRMKFAVGFLISWGSVDFWRKAANAIHAVCHDDGSARVTIPAGRKKFFGELYSRSSVLDLCEMKFEGRMLPVPQCCDEYLTRLYGDYMVPPAPADREKHPYMAKPKFCEED